MSLPPLRGMVIEIQSGQLNLLAAREREDATRWVAQHDQDPHQVVGIRVSPRGRVVRFLRYVLDEQGRKVIVGDTAVTEEVEVDLRTGYQPWMRVGEIYEPNPYPKDERQEAAFANELKAEARIHDADGKLIEVITDGE